MEHVEDDERAARVPDVAEVVDRDPADVDADLAGDDRLERRDLPGQGVVKAKGAYRISPR
jgi:hypothetical protein